MTDKNFNADTDAALLQQHQLQSVQRAHVLRGLKWVALVVSVLFALDSVLMRVFTPINQRLYGSGIQAVQNVWVGRGKYREYVEVRRSVTEEEAREMLVKQKMRTVIGEFYALGPDEKLIW